jgi:hypothetical protein
MSCLFTVTRTEQSGSVFHVNQVKIIISTDDGLSRMTKLTSIIKLSLLALSMCANAVAQSSVPYAQGHGLVLAPNTSAPPSTQCIVNPAKNEFGMPGFRMCAFPSFQSCTDKDNDGIIGSCGGENKTTGLYGTRDLDKNFTPYVAADWSLADPQSKPDWIGVGRCDKVEVVGGRTNYVANEGIYKDYEWEQLLTTCHAAYGKNSDVRFDCDDSSPTIGWNGDSNNAAAIESIVYVARDEVDVKIAKERNNVDLRDPRWGKAFNPLETIVIGIKTSPCIRSLRVKASLDLGVGGAINLGAIDFSQPWYPHSSIPLFAPAGPGILYGHLNDLYLDPSTLSLTQTTNNKQVYNDALGSILANIRLLREKSGKTNTTTAGPVPAILTLTPVFNNIKDLASTSIPISLDTCVPISGDGPISVTTRRSTNLLSFLGADWATRPSAVAGALAHHVLAGRTPLGNNRDLFTIVADLSVMSETGADKNEFGSSILNITGPASCGGRINVFESAINKRAYVHGETIYTDTTMYSPSSVYIMSPYLLMLMHELGHALGKLRDEYDVIGWNPGWSPGTDHAYSYLNGRNCARESEISSAFPWPASIPVPSRAICGARGLYRSTIGSIMNNHITHPKFNIISCAYLYVEMRGGNPEDFYSICQGADHDTYRD